MSLELISIL
jgi:hypothetical protein